MKVVAGCVCLLMIAWGCPAAGQDNPHGELSVSCNACHTTDSWRVDLSAITFDHGHTSFPLAGQHQSVPCRQCHASLTFSAAPGRCASCHEDIHRGELGMSCDRCHTPQSWLVPDMPRRHAQTRFPLTGFHLTAQCEQCHVSEQKHQYVGVSAECYACHRKDYQATVAPAHASSGISTDCILCHSSRAISWGGSFDHASTGFPLAGAHATAACGACHTANRFVGTPRDCYSCHQSSYTATTNPPHAAAGFSTNCEQCHSATAASWTGSFNHTQTGFALTGIHATATCNACHAGGRFKGTPTDCYSCHQADFTATTNPAHVAGGFPTNCVQCHAATAVSWNASFDHTQTGFSLTGIHATTACASCHPANRFKGTPTDCYGCHQADFVATNNPAHVAAGFPTTCVTCHLANASSWNASFDHTQTGFSLTGIHATTACASCHPANRFKGTPTDCYGCHQADFVATNNPAHVAAGFPTTCVTCHLANASSWNASFDHSTTGFALTGAHATGSCVSCHAGNRFAGTPTDCYSCHSADYTGATNPVHTPGAFPTTCVTCHTTTAWQPSTFNHTTYFPISAGSTHSPGRWSTCADCHTNPTNYAVFSCLNCHEHVQTTMDSRHARVSGYSYDSQACYRCHPRGSGG